ncbi:MAG: hypothetical protein WAT39_22390, partial [Planctomycetota bacterium]
MNRRGDALERWQAWALLGLAVGIGTWWRGELAAVEQGLVAMERELDGEPAGGGAGGDRAHGSV